MKLAVIGNPIAFSKSPIIFNFFFKEMKMEGIYTKILLNSVEEFPALFEKDYSGFSITAPFKQSIMPHLDLLGEEVIQIGSVNTVVLKDGKSYGYNTDYWGVLNAFSENGVDVSSKKCLIIGAGGAARAAVYAMKSKDAFVKVYSRSEAKAKALAVEFNVEYCTIHHLQKSLSEAEILIDTLPACIELIPEEWLHKGLAVLDASYPTSVYANKNGIRLIGGEQWLLHQAIPAFKLFTGIALNKDYNQKELLDLLIKS